MSRWAFTQRVTLFLDDAGGRRVTRRKRAGNVFIVVVAYQKRVPNFDVRTA